MTNIWIHFLHYSLANNINNDLPTININEISFNENYVKLGEGTYGAVRSGRYKEADVAVKCFNNCSSASCAREVTNLLKLSRSNLSPINHPNIITFLGKLEYFDGMFTKRGIVMELMHIDLSSLMHNSQITYSRNEAYLWLKQTADGLAFLHANNIIHRDVKPQNLLLDETLKTIKICDFGISKIVDESSMTPCLGTYCYMAPEVIKARKAKAAYGTSADAYSFTIVAYEVIYQRVPYEHLLKISHLEKCNRIVDGERPNLNIEGNDVSKEIKTVLKRGWHVDSDRRPTMNDFLNFFDLIADSDQMDMSISRLSCGSFSMIPPIPRKPAMEQSVKTEIPLPNNLSILTPLGDAGTSHALLPTENARADKKYPDHVVAAPKQLATNGNIRLPRTESQETSKLEENPPRKPEIPLLLDNIASTSQREYVSNFPPLNDPSPLPIQHLQSNQYDDCIREGCIFHSLGSGLFRSESEETIVGNRIPSLSDVDSIDINSNSSILYIPHLDKVSVSVCNSSEDSNSDEEHVYIPHKCSSFTIKR